MSIANTIKVLDDAKRLFPYLPQATRRPARRRVYLTQEAASDFDDPRSAVNLLCGRGSIVAALTRWVLGDRVYGDQRGGRFLTMLHPPPPHIWEVRVTDPVPQARLLGRFAEPDTLILMKFHTRNYLGDKGSDQWNSAMIECDRQWSELFPGALPFSGSSISEYVTENCDDFPLCKSFSSGGSRPGRIRRR